MPELPDIQIYLEALESHTLGQRLDRIVIQNLFVLRSVDPPPSALEGCVVTAVQRLGKRIVLGLENEFFVVIHLMIAGRLRWVGREGKFPGGKLAVARFEFPRGVLVFTEAGTKRRASLHLVRGLAGLEEFRRGGLEVLGASVEAFGERLRKENHTLKRSLTDPRLFSGIGNAYSDEILHRARLAPLTLSQRLSAEEIARLFAATRDVLTEWIERLRAQCAGGFPEKVTAFRPEMAVHGRYGLPCPLCASPVQRIVYADNETNYCARCQTGGKLLADRALSRLLKKDWPKSIDEVE